MNAHAIQKVRDAWSGAPGGLVIEAGRGQKRRQSLQELAGEARARGVEVLWASCALEMGGPWAGLADILRALLPRIETWSPETVRRHRYELALALPELRDRFPLSEASLTDASPVKEKVRSYPVDRAYRLLHGLIDLLDGWLREQPGRLLVVCDDFDRAGALMRRFFQELVRRRLHRLPLHLALVVDEGQGDAAAEQAGLSAAHVVRLDLPRTAEVVDRDEMARRADELEARITARLTRCDNELPRLIHYCLESGQLPRAQRWRAVALGVYNHFGLYEDALAFGEPLIAALDGPDADTIAFSRWNVVSGLFNALVALGQAERAYQIVHDEAYLKVTDPKDLVNIYYSLAMLHCRFLPRKDLAKAEELLWKALDTIDRTGFEESEKHYLAVFNLNGLAFIRHLQGRVEEAVELCRSGFDRLNTHLRDDQYRLHRSVLLYNIAQVHTATKSYDEAIRHYTAALEIDPRYSEYYNERGNVFLKTGRPGEAVVDYRRAIELSAPYQEVWTNLGQAYKLLGQAREAVDAYSVAIDLDPRQVLPRLGRAQAFEMLGQADAALADYTAALVLDPTSAQVWSNRAVIHYEAGRLAEAEADLDEAIRRAPDLPDLHANRAVVREERCRLAPPSPASSPAAGAPA